MANTSIDVWLSRSIDALRGLIARSATETGGHAAPISAALGLYTSHKGVDSAGPPAGSSGSD